MVALEKPGSRVTARHLIIANITTIIGAALALIWNAAATYTRFAQLEAEQGRLSAVQRSIIEEQVKHDTDLQNEQEARLLLDGRVYRLEDLSLAKGR